jgi:hypothetical protein
MSNNKIFFKKKMLEKTRENPSLLNNPLLAIWDQVKIIFFFKKKTNKNRS